MPVFPHKPQKTNKINTKYRIIKTQIPVPQSLPLLKKAYKYEISSMHGQMPIIWNKAENFQVHDQWGNKWIVSQALFLLLTQGTAIKK